MPTRRVCILCISDWQWGYGVEVWIVLTGDYICTDVMHDSYFLEEVQEDAS